MSLRHLSLVGNVVWWVHAHQFGFALELLQVFVQFFRQGIPIDECAVSFFV